MATLPIDVGHRQEAGRIFAELASFTRRVRAVLLDLSLSDLYRLMGEVALMDRTLKEIEDLVRLRRERDEVSLKQRLEGIWAVLEALSPEQIAESVQEIEDLVRLRQELGQHVEVVALAQLARLNPRLADGIPKPLLYAPPKTEEERERRRASLMEQREAMSLHLPAPSAPHRTFDFAS